MTFFKIEEVRGYTRKILFLLTVLISIFLLWYLYENWVYFFTPKIPSPTIPTRENQNLARNMRVGFSTNVIDFIEPKVFQIQSRKTFSQSEAQKIAKILNFQEQSSFDPNLNSYRWEKENETLEIYLTNLSLRYSRGKTNLTQGSEIKLDGVKKKFKNLYQELGLNTNVLDFEQPEVTYALSFEHYHNKEEKHSEKQISSQEANLVFLNFPLRFQGKGIVGLYPDHYKASATFGRDDTLLALDLQLILDKWEEFSSYPKLTKDSLRQEVAHDKATLVHYLNTTFPSRKTEPLKSIVINKVSAAYLLPELDYNYLIPIYILEATGVGRDGLGIEATFYLPAFKSILFK